jgi:meiosis-specific protein
MLGRRFATFKVFYTEDTPEEYEPPGFHAGDYERDKFVFKTHSSSEEPEEHKIGVAQSGHHSQVFVFIDHS